MGGIVSLCFTLQSPTGILIIFLSRQGLLPLYKEARRLTHSTSLSTQLIQTEQNLSTLLKPSTQSNFQRSQELCFRFLVEARHSTDTQSINQTNTNTNQLQPVTLQSLFETPILSAPPPRILQSSPDSTLVPRNHPY